VSVRCKGQEVELILMVDGSPMQNFSFIRSTEMTWKTELIQEGYLNETTDRYDTIFKGIGGKAQMHFDSPDFLNLVRWVVEKAQNRVPGTRFNIKQTINFPSGRRARVLVPEISFGPMPMDFSSRAAYGGFSVDYGASNAYALVV
jgi:hypothetical protein